MLDKVSGSDRKGKKCQRTKIQFKIEEVWKIRQPYRKLGTEISEEYVR